MCGKMNNQPYCTSYSHVHQDTKVLTRGQLFLVLVSQAHSRQGMMTTLGHDQPRHVLFLIEGECVSPCGSKLI
jgi:hypothetical protein